MGNDLGVRRPYVLGAMTPSGKRRVDRGDSWGDLDPVQVTMLEALRWIGEPLSAIGLVDVLDGYLSMWEAKDHLQSLQKDRVVMPVSADELDEPVGEFDQLYRLR